MIAIWPAGVLLSNVFVEQQAHDQEQIFNCNWRSTAG